MILEYFRPKSITEAIALLNRKHPVTIPLAGGSTVGKRLNDVAVVDLQSLELNYIKQENGLTRIGATTKLDSIATEFINNPFLLEPLKIQASKNQRNSGSLGGLVCSANGRSPVLTALLALDASILFAPGENEISLAKWLPIRNEWTKGKLVTEVKFSNDMKGAFESIARSPLDQPIVCCAAVKTQNGIIRLAFGGFGPYPKVILVASEITSLYGILEKELADTSDEWASAEYRIDASKKLATRLIKLL
jgi:CO/xanthine dehydrogenase FAD-binding subunit